MKGKAKVCYTGFALSDLAVSSGLPFIPASLPGTDFSPSPYSVNPSVSHPENSHWTAMTVCREGFEDCRLLDWTGAILNLKPGMSGAGLPFGNEPSGYW